MRSRFSLRRTLTSCLIFGVFVVLLAVYDVTLNAQNTGGENFVYVMTNKNPGNSVLQFRRASDGSLAWLREVPTGGAGTGPNGADPLGSQDSLVLNGDGRRLLAANSGSNEISVLEVRDGRLRWLSKAASGGTFPNSVALFGDLAYVLNAEGVPNITGFRLESNGTLSPIPHATVVLPGGGTGANDIRFTPDGSQLLVTVSGTNQILLFNVGDNGVAGTPVVLPSAGGSPFGIRFGHHDVVLVSEAAGSVSSYQIDDDTLNVITPALANTQAASCWISVTRSGREAFVSNTASGTISTYGIDGRGRLSLFQPVAANPGGAPIDSALSRDSRFLYVMESGQGRVLVLRNDSNALVQVGIVSIPIGSQGIAAE